MRTPDVARRPDFNDAWAEDLVDSLAQSLCHVSRDKLPKRYRSVATNAWSQSKASRSSILAIVLAACGALETMIEISSFLRCGHPAR